MLLFASMEPAQKITCGPIPGTTYIFLTKFEKLIGHFSYIKTRPESG